MEATAPSSPALLSLSNATRRPFVLGFHLLPVLRSESWCKPPKATRLPIVLFNKTNWSCQLAQLEADHRNLGPAHRVEHPMRTWGAVSDIPMSCRSRPGSHCVHFQKLLSPQRLLGALGEAVMYPGPFCSDDPSPTPGQCWISA
jgi:hypothetical protein